MWYGLNPSIFYLFFIPYCITWKIIIVHVFIYYFSCRIFMQSLDCEIQAQGQNPSIWNIEWIMRVLFSYRDSITTMLNKTQMCLNCILSVIHLVMHLTVSELQYILRNMHTVFALLCFVVVIHWLIFPYPSGLLHWHCGNLTITPVPAKQPWWIWINTSCEFIMNDCITTTKQSTTKPCAYFLGYTVCTRQVCGLFSGPLVVVQG